MTDDYTTPVPRASGMPSDAEHIPGFPGYYATPGGEIWSTKVSPGGARMSQKPTDRGYIQYQLWVDGRMVRTSAHRLVLLCFKGAPPDGKPFALHCDGDSSNNSIDNLRWGSHADNVRDSVIHGTHDSPRGERAWKSVLTEDDVRAIRASKEKGVTLAAMYGVGKSAISMARRGITWKSVEDANAE